MIIYTHPNNLELLKKEFSKAENFHNTFNSIPIIADPLLEEFSIDTTIWERTEIMPDTKFTTWVEDLLNPPSWAIFFGLVKRPKFRNFILSDNNLYDFSTTPTK